MLLHSDSLLLMARVDHVLRALDMEIEQKPNALYTQDQTQTQPNNTGSSKEAFSQQQLISFVSMLRTEQYIHGVFIVSCQPITPSGSAPSWELEWLAEGTNVFALTYKTKYTKIIGDTYKDYGQERTLYFGIANANRSAELPHHTPADGNEMCIFMYTPALRSGGGDEHCRRVYMFNKPTADKTLRFDAYFEVMMYVNFVCDKLRHPVIEWLGTLWPNNQNVSEPIGNGMIVNSVWPVAARNGVAWIVAYRKRGERHRIEVNLKFGGAMLNDTQITFDKLQAMMEEQAPYREPYQQT